MTAEGRSASPTGGEAHAFYWRTDAMDASQMQSALELLSSEERQRCRRLAVPADQRDYAAAHALLRAALWTQTQIAPDRLIVARDSHGKPFVPRGTVSDPPGISLAHCRGLVACAVAPAGAIGIDVERIDPTLDAIGVARQLFAPDEAAALEACSGPERAARFCELWTLREALFKAAGLGLGLPRASASFQIDGGAVTLAVRLPLLDAAWTCTVTDLGGTHKLAVVASAGVGQRRCVAITEADAAVLVGR